MNIKIKKLILINIIFLLIPFLLKGQVVNLELKVVDKAGMPIKNAKIYTEEGSKVINVDSTGKVQLEVFENSIIVIRAEGFKPVIAQINQDIKEIVLLEDDGQYVVNLGYKKVFSKELTGSVAVINTKDYVDIDYDRNVIGSMTGRINGLQWYNNIWGLQNATVLVDGVPRNFGDITIDEVEQISVLKSAHSIAMYGSLGAKGIILITTKRGEPYNKKVNARVNSYLGVPIMYPKYLNAAEYMTLYNEARRNDGLPEKYSVQEIENYRSGNKLKYPDIDYYSSEYLRKFVNNYNANVEFSGGNRNAAFYTNIGYDINSTLLNFGEGKNEKDQRFNARGNVDLRLNDFIKSSIDVSTVFYDNRRANGNYWGNAATILPFKFTPLLPITALNDSLWEFIRTTSRNIIDGKYIVGGTQEYMTHPFGDVYVGGYNKNVGRVLQVTNKIEVDLNKVLQGLALNTNIFADYRNSYNQFISNEYAVYYPTWQGDTITGLTKFGRDYRPGTENINNTSQTRSVGASVQLQYKRTFNEINDFAGYLFGSAISINRSGVYQPDKFTSLGAEINYKLNNKYLVEAVGVIVNSTKLPSKNKVGFSPSLSLSWIASNENFIKNINFIDFLKLSTSVSSIKYDLDINGYFLYENYFVSQGYYTWNDNISGANNSYTVSLRGDNPDLTYPVRKEFTVSLEASLLKNLIWLEGNLFVTRLDGLITQRFSLYPSFLSDFVPYTNYNCNQYSGFDAKLLFNKNINEVKLQLGLMTTYVNSKVIKRDELYAYSYLERKGKPVDAIFGLENAGFFMSQEDINNSPIQMFGEVKPGDIKYKDQNGDNVINQNDEVMIGRWIAPFNYGLTFTLSYKNLTFNILGTGNIGGNGVKTNDYYWVDGDDKYSVIVLDRWTEENKYNAKFPRLSSLRNENNFRYSDFWMYSTDRFDINRLQLTYNVPKNIIGQKVVKELKFNFSAYNLVTISKNRDILLLSIGNAPNMRYFNFGIKANF